jgi:ABC-type nitrate/sulfonate/bicarbonate transport system permease component
MSELQIIDTNISAAQGSDEFDVPVKSLWQRSEAMVYGVGSIVGLLVVWQLLPHLITVSEGTKLFFTTPSQIAGTLWDMFATGSIWHPLGVRLWLRCRLAW